jgi:hypothetical protein
MKTKTKKSTKALTGLIDLLDDACCICKELTYRAGQLEAMQDDCIDELGEELGEEVREATNLNITVDDQVGTLSDAIETLKEIRKGI